MGILKNISILLFATIVSACASLPPELDRVGAKVLVKCADAGQPAEPSNGGLLISIESDALINSWYFELTNMESNKKYFLFMEPRKFALPSRKFFETYRLPARKYCYRIESGTYRIEKAHGFLTTIRTNGNIQSTSTEYREYPFNYSFSAASGKITYLGRIIAEDPEFAGKGYFGHMGAMMKKAFMGLFSGEMISETIVFRQEDEYQDDKAWLDSEYKTLTIGLRQR